MSDTIKIYTSSDLVRDIIADDFHLLVVLNRFRIPFGFGNNTVAKVCADNGVDVDTFLAVANLASHDTITGNGIDVSCLVAYLKESHSYILDFALPHIKQQLVLGIHQSELNDAALLTLKFFDEYIKEVRKHMEFENETVFPYIEQLIDGEPLDEFTIKSFASKHERMTIKLDEFKDLFLRHYVLPNTRNLSHALISIISCGKDLDTHCQIEESLLVPAVEHLERQAQKNTPHPTRQRRDAPTAPEANADDLSDREKEIIRLVAHGLSNKEIADKLNLSFHTITTYRKKIATKLNIHSAAALTIFAIINGIVNPKEIQLK